MRPTRSDGDGAGFRARAARPALLAALALMVLASAGLTHTPLTGKPSEAGQAVLPGDEPNGTYAGYWSWPGIVAELERHQREHPDLVRIHAIGKTFEGRDILAVKITRDVEQDDPEKPEVLFMAGIHPREQQPQVALMRFVDDLLAGYGRASRLTRLLDTRALWVIPIYNVDGKVYDFRHGNGRTRGANWRKTRRPNADGSRGVDLNRNGLVGWGGGDEPPSSQTYHGPGPLSEPESQALFQFMAARRFRVFLDLHSSMASYLMPGHLIREEAERYDRLTRGMQERQRQPYRGAVLRGETEAGANSGTGVGQTHVTGLYLHGAYSYVFEIGLSGFYPPAEEIVGHYEENLREPWLFLLEEAANLPPKERGDHFTLKRAALTGRLTPGARAQWTPQVEGEVAYGVLVSRHAAVRVTGDYRLYPLTERGYTLNVSETARPGTEVPLQLYLWDRQRRQSVIDVTVRVAG